MVKVCVEKLANPGGVHVADLQSRTVYGFVSLPAKSWGRFAVFYFPQNIRSCRTAHLDDKPVVVLRYDLLQREIIDEQKQVGADSVQFTATTISAAAGLGKSDP